MSPLAESGSSTRSAGLMPLNMSGWPRGGVTSAEKAASEKVLAFVSASAAGAFKDAAIKPRASRRDGWSGKDRMRGPFVFEGASDGSDRNNGSGRGPSNSHGRDSFVKVGC